MNPRIFGLGLGLGLLTCVALGAQGAEEEKSAESPMNSVTRMAPTPTGFEFEVTSSRPFPVRALPPVLKIGDREFARSRHPEDGRLDTLIFLLPTNAWGQLTAGAPISVHFALSIELLEDGSVRSTPERSGFVWDFGTLNKSLLEGAAR